MLKYGHKSGVKMTGVEFGGIEGDAPDQGPVVGAPESLNDFADRVQLDPRSAAAVRAFGAELVRRQGYIAESLGVTTEALHAGQVPAQPGPELPPEA